MRKFFLLFFLLLTGKASAVTATDATQGAVEAAIASTAVGGTVQVPAGSASWSGLSINKAIHLRGAGIGVTVITLTGNNTVTKQAAGVTRISNFTFNKTAGGNNSKGWSFGGSWKGAKPIIFNGNDVNISGSGFIGISVAGGVIIANNDFTGEVDDSFIAPKQPGDNDGSWRSNSTMGTADINGEWNIYVEDNTFYGGGNQGIDADDASRVVFRHNICKYMTFNSHGLDTSEDGIRHFEVYNNQFLDQSAPGYVSTATIANHNQLIWIRGGTGVIFNNFMEDIAGSHWGNKPEGKFDIRAQEDNSGTAYGTLPPPVAKYSAGQGNYPRERQLGQSWNEALTNTAGINGGVGDYITDPIYIWGNTGSGSSGGGFLGFANGGSWGSQTGYFNSGRDYFMGTTAKPGYTAYAHPHPLIAGAVSDTTPPTVTSAAINAAGTQLTLNTSETVSIGTGGNGGLTISASGGAVTLTFVSGSGSSALVYNTSRNILTGETITRTYVQPGNGIEDTAGNDLASFSAQTVTNGVTGDATAPVPNPMTFSSQPVATTSFSITMTASLATDAGSPPVQYYFDEISGNPGGTDSGWTTNRTYTNNFLSPGIQYTYRVLARDSAAVPNQTTPSSAVNVTTPIIAGGKVITPAKANGAAFAEP